MRAQGLFVALCAALLAADQAEGAALARATAGKKKKKAAAPGKGFGAPAAKGFGTSTPAGAALADPLSLPGCDPNIVAAINAKAQAVISQPAVGRSWLELGAVLVKANEYAEAERVFRAGAAVAEGDEMLSGAALTLGGDSSAYYHGEPGERPSVLSARVIPDPIKTAMGDDAFDGFQVPAENVLRYDQADRATDWSCAPDLAARGAVFKSKAPLLKPEECAWVIETVEEFATQNGGWTTKRHVEAPTTDIPVSQVEPIREWFDIVLRDTLFPMLHARYPSLIASPDELRVMDAFVVRYDAGAQASLPVHVDENTFSFTIALNDQSEYEGGGTLIEQARPVGDSEANFKQTVLNADAGGVVTFPGKLRHGGNTVTEGRRYIIPLFIYADVNKSGKKPGYIFSHFGLELPDEKNGRGLARY